MPHVVMFVNYVVCKRGDTNHFLSFSSSFRDIRNKYFMQEVVSVEDIIIYFN